MQEYVPLHPPLIVDGRWTGNYRQTKSLRKLFANLRLERDGCITYHGTLSRGYGILNSLGYGHTAYRVLWGWFHGSAPPKASEMELDHLCRNTLCVHPDHLELVWRRVNKARSNTANAINARKTHCLNGHEFTPENTLPQTLAGRGCRICHNTRTRVNRAAARARIAPV